MRLHNKSLVMVEVIDNFLPEHQFKTLQSIMMGEEFIWFYKDYIAYEGVEDGQYQFTHTFWASRGVDPCAEIDAGSTFLKLVESFQELGRMHRIKSNLRTRTIFHRRSSYHIDGVPNCTKTAIFYVNTSNGWTQFKRGGKKIKSVANRLLVFDSNLEHAGFSCTDKKRRVVINFNYE